MTDAADDGLATLEARLGHRFRDRTLLRQALTHASHAHETTGEGSNERLEFLGDAVIGVVVAHLLFETRPEWREGELTRALHDLVDRRALARLARNLEIGSRLRLGRTEQQSGGQEKESILADAMEAILGAMFLDAGLAPVRALAERVFEEALHVDAPPVERDPKTRLQESVMAARGIFPRYELVQDNQVEGDERRFTVRVCVGEEDWGTGVGRTKRAAERAAAEAAWERVETEASRGAD